jgi:hypothetical protein
MSSIINREFNNGFIVGLASKSGVKGGVTMGTNYTAQVDSDSTHTQIPTAKSVYDYVQIVKKEIEGDLDEVLAVIGGVE